MIVATDGDEEGPGRVVLLDEFGRESSRTLLLPEEDDFERGRELLRRIECGGIVSRDGD